MCDGLLASITPVDMVMSIVLLVCNILVAGLGTIINAFMGDGMNSTALIVGILQFLLMFFFGIGWIWSVIWGVLFVMRAKK